MSVERWALNDEPNEMGQSKQDSVGLGCIFRDGSGLQFDLAAYGGAERVSGVACHDVAGHSVGRKLPRWARDALERSATLEPRGCLIGPPALVTAIAGALVRALSLHDVVGLEAHATGGELLTSSACTWRGALVSLIGHLARANHTQSSPFQCPRRRLKAELRAVSADLVGDHRIPHSTDVRDNEQPDRWVAEAEHEHLVGTQMIRDDGQYPSFTDLGAMHTDLHGQIVAGTARGEQTLLDVRLRGAQAGLDSKRRNQERGTGSNHVQPMPHPNLLDSIYASAEQDVAQARCSCPQDFTRLRRGTINQRARRQITVGTLRHEVITINSLRLISRCGRGGCQSRWPARTTRGALVRPAPLAHRAPTVTD